MFLRSYTVVRASDVFMSDEEAILHVHPLRQVSVFIYAPLVLMDTYFILFTLTLRALALGTPHWMVGWITPIYTLASFLTVLFWGWMADQYGRRHPLIVSGVFTVVGLVGFALATEPWHLLVASAIRGIGGSAGFMIARVLVADLAPRKALGERLAGLSIALFAVLQIGFAIAAPLYEIDPRLPFVLAAIPEGVALLLAIFVVPETLVKEKSQREVMGTEERKLSQMDQFGNGVREWLLALTQRGAALYIFSVLVGSFVGFVAGTIAFPLFVTRLGLSPTQISIVYTGGIMISLLGQIPGGILSDKIGRKWPVLFAGFWGALMWPLYTLLQGMADPFLWVFLIYLASSGASFVVGPAFLAYFFEWIPTRGRGRASAVTEIFKDLVSIILLLVGLLSGFSLSEFYDMLTKNPESLFYFAAIIGMLVYIIIWVAWKEAPLPEEKWKLRTSTIVLIAAEIILAIVVIVWLFFFRLPLL